MQDFEIISNYMWADQVAESFSKIFYDEARFNVISNTKYVFHPNMLARALFKLERNCYIGTSLSELMQRVLGEDNYDRYMFAQDPFNNTNATPHIDICINGEYYTIGTIERDN